MSEFKYACPVCGQHIECDSSQAGMVMSCPTCFQKVVVPQAPVGEKHKFVLTGTRLEEKRPTTLAEAAERSPRQTRPFPVAAMSFVLAAGLAVGTGLYFYGDPILRWLNHWRDLDVGSVGVPGSFSRAGKSWNVAGSGADIWGQYDGFHFVCRPAGGNVSLGTRVVALQDTDPWAKAGLMVRDSLAPDSPYAMVLVTSHSGVAFQQRANSGSQATSVTVASSVPAPCWMRLIRQDDLFTADYSTDGRSWVSLGSTTIPMQRDAWAGLAVTAHNDTALCKAGFDHVTIRSGEQRRQLAHSPPTAPTADTNEAAAPSANSEAWTLVLNRPAIPDSPVAGRIRDQDFVAERASFQNGALVLLAAKHGSNFAAMIDFGGTAPEELAGKTIDMTTNAERAAKVTLRWKDDAGKMQSTTFNAGYALRLQWGVLDDNRLPGKIYLCLPDPQKSYLAGSFEARVVSPKPRPQSTPQ